MQSDFKHQVTGILLYEISDSISFSKEELIYFTRCCNNCITKLKENKQDIDIEINQIVDQYIDNIKNAKLYIDFNNMLLFMRIDDIKISLYLEPKVQHTIPAGYDPLKNEILLFINSFEDALKKETLINLRHELQHHFDLMNLSPKERLKHKTINLQTDNEYYTDEFEYNAHLRTFLDVAEHVLFNNIIPGKVETDFKRIPKKDVYELFNYINSGKLNIEAHWFNTLSDEQKRDVLNKMLERFAESFNTSNTKLNLRENRLLFQYYNKK